LLKSFLITRVALQDWIAKHEINREAKLASGKAQTKSEKKLVVRRLEITDH
jgi:hypothetical protein